MIRVLRYLVRIPLLLVHLLVLLPIAMVLVSVPWARRGEHGQRLDNRVIRWWSAGLVRVFGFRLRRVGKPLQGAVLFVANHVSWIDITLRHAVAVCPAVDPAGVLQALETGLPLYHWYFMRKWRRSLARKRALFPDLHDFDDGVLALDMRGLTGWMVKRHTTLAGIEDYFDGYNIGGGRLAPLQVPVSVLAAADDPVIPVGDFPALRLPAHSTLQIADFGGHCGFIEGAGLRGYAERWVADRLEAAVDAAARATMPAPASA